MRWTWIATSRRKAAHEGKQGAVDQSQGEEDFKALRDLNLDGKLRVGKLKVADLRLEDLSAQLSAKDGVLRLDPSAAKLYGGTYTGKLTLDVTSDDLKLDLDQSLAGVQSGGLLTDFAEVSELQGVMAANIKASGRGASQDDLLRNLQGNLSFDLADGVYQGMDIWQEIRKARALIRRKPPPAATGPNETRINALKLDGRLQDGVLRSERMVGEIPFLRLSGSGNVNVISQALDYRFQAKVFETPTFADGETYDDLLNVSIPLTIGGTVESPKIGVDLANLLKDAAVQKATEKLLDRLGLGEPKKPAAPAPAPEAGSAPNAAPSEQAPEQQPAEQQPAQEESPRDALRRELRDLLKR
jgi:AsmA protein